MKVTKPQLKLLRLIKDTTWEQYTVPGFLAHKMWPRSEYPAAWRPSRQGVCGQWLPGKIGSMLNRLEAKGLVRRRCSDTYQTLWYISDKGKSVIAKFGEKSWQDVRKANT